MLPGRHYRVGGTAWLGLAPQAPSEGSEYTPTMDQPLDEGSSEGEDGATPGHRVYKCVQK